jgi:hypothetical protein
MTQHIPGCALQTEVAQLAKVPVRRLGEDSDVIPAEGCDMVPDGLVNSLNPATEYDNQILVLERLPAKIVDAPDRERQSFPERQRDQEAAHANIFVRLDPLL